MYIDSCLNMAPLSKNNKEQVMGIYSFLVPDTWHTEGNRERVKVEVDRSLVFDKSLKVNLKQCPVSLLVIQLIRLVR